jgi:hypothetical protein
MGPRNSGLQQLLHKHWRKNGSEWKSPTDKDAMTATLKSMRMQHVNVLP